MALFFDGEWFDERMAARSLERVDVARVLGIGEGELDLAWKDQRELSAREVNELALLLGTTITEVAEHAGVSTPNPEAAPSEAPDLSNMLVELNERMTRIEGAMAELKALILDPRRRR